MAYRFVRATPIEDRLPELREQLDSGEIETLEPFGAAMKRSLDDARVDPETGEAVWIEEDYCSPQPDVDEEEGWSRIDAFPGLWEN
jgi:hypothetical protein